MTQIFCPEHNLILYSQSFLYNILVWSATGIVPPCLPYDLLSKPEKNMSTYDCAIDATWLRIYHSDEHESLTAVDQNFQDESGKYRNKGVFTIFKHTAS
jgi:hypothetical protein